MSVFLFQLLSISPVSTIPPTLHTYLHLYQENRNLGTYTQRNATSDIGKHSRDNTRTCTLLYSKLRRLTSRQNYGYPVSITHWGFHDIIVGAGRGNSRHHCSYWLNELSHLVKLTPLWHGQHETITDLDATCNSVTFKTTYILFI
jgi:hypothetical protein